MKKTLLSLMAILATTTLSAETYSKLEYTQTFAQERNILSIQPISELLGESSSILKLGYGVDLGKEEKLGGRFGLYGSGDMKNKEYGLGLDFEIDFPKASMGGFVPFFGGDVGIGLRTNKGDTKNLSTSINKVTAITAVDFGPYRTPSVATFDEDSTYFMTGFQLGVNYEFSTNLKGSFGYVFQKKTYDIAYRLDSSPNVLNAVTFDQRNNGVLVSLQYVY